MSDGRSPFETVIDAVDWASRSAEPTPSRGDYAVAGRAEEATDFAWKPSGGPSMVSGDYRVRSRRRLLSAWVEKIDG